MAGITKVERVLARHGYPPLEPRDVKRQARLLRDINAAGPLALHEQTEIIETGYNYRIADCGTDCDGSFATIVREGQNEQKDIAYLEGLNVCGKTPLEAKELITRVCTEQPYRFHWDSHTPVVEMYGFEVSSENSVTRIFRLWKDNLLDVADMSGVISFESTEELNEFAANLNTDDWCEYLGSDQQIL